MKRLGRKNSKQKSDESLPNETEMKNQSLDESDSLSTSRVSFRRKSKKNAASLDILHYSKSTNNNIANNKKSNLGLTRTKTSPDKGKQHIDEKYTSEHLEDAYSKAKATKTSSCEEIFDLLEELSIFEEMLEPDEIQENKCKSDSMSTSNHSGSNIKRDSLEDPKKSTDINQDTSNPINKAPNQSVIEHKKVDSFSTNESKSGDNKSSYGLYEDRTESESINTTIDIEAYDDNDVKSSRGQSLGITNDIQNNQSVERNKLCKISTMDNVQLSPKELICSSKESVTSGKQTDPQKRKKKDDYESVRESKIKSRMTLFNAYKVLKNSSTKMLSLDIFSPMEIDERKNLIKDFYKKELGYFKCVKYVAKFENLIVESMKSSSTAIFSKNEFNKIQLNYISLEKHMKRLEVLLDSKKNSMDSDFCVVDYFGELTPLRIDYKMIALSMDKFLLLITKNKSSPKMKKIYLQELRISELNIILSVEGAINYIYEHIHEYIEFLDSLMSLTKTTDQEYKHIRIVTNQIIILWDVIKVCRIGKKNSVITRTLTLTTPVVELCGEDKRKYRILYIFMDCLVIASQSTKSPIDLIAKYCLPVKKCVCSRTFQANSSIPQNLTKKLNYLKGRIASTKDMISKFEHSSKKSDYSKIDKLNKQMNEDQYQLLLVSPQYPLSVCYNHKLTQTFLFDNEYDASYWEFVINSRSSCALMEETAATLSEVQSLINDFTSNLLKIENNNNGIQHYIEEPYIPPTDEHKEETEPVIPTEYMNQCLRMNVMFRRNENLNGDIYFKFECDYYNILFEKYKSTVLKPNDLTCSSIFVLTEQSQSISFTLFKLKGKNESISSGPINLCQMGILNKPFVRFHHKFENFGSLIVYAECYNTELMFDESYKILINSINHFQPSIDYICQSENTAIPDVLRICIEKIEEIGLETVGIYRISGIANKVIQLREEFSKNMIFDGEDLEDYDIHDLCGTVKSFLRDLQIRLIPKDCVEYFLTWNNFVEKQISDLHSCVEKLPRANQNTFYFLMNHLVKILRMSAVNKMTSANLSTVFSPNLFGGDQSENAQQESLFTYVSIVKAFIDVSDSST